MNPMVLVYLFVCLLFIGFFTVSVIAFHSVGKLPIEIRRKQGTFSGRVLGRFLEAPSKFLATNLVGVHMALIIYGVLVMEISRPLWGTGEELLHLTFIRFIVLTFLASLIVLVFAELIPKVILRRRAAQILAAFAAPQYLLYPLLYPLARALMSVSRFILKYLFNVRIREQQPIFVRMDLEHYIRHTLRGQQSLTEEINAELFENALYLVNVKLRKCMTPRNEVLAISVGESIESAREKLVRSRQSKMTVYQDSIDQIVGYIHHLDLHRQPGRIEDILHEIPVVPETMSALDMLNQFTKERKSIAWVIDEYGGTAGIVTMEDILEEIFGQIHEESEVSDRLEKQISDQEFLFSGRLELDYLNDKYGFGFPTDGQETLSGYIIAHHETIPKQSEHMIIEDYAFDIIRVSDTRIETVKMRILKY